MVRKYGIALKILTQINSSQYGHGCANYICNTLIQLIPKKQKITLGPMSHTDIKFCLKMGLHTQSIDTFICVQTIIKQEIGLLQT